MSEVDTIRDLLVSDNEAKDLVADANVNAVSRLFRDLRYAASACDRPHGEVARIIGISDTDVEEILEGHVDLTLTELNQVAYALDAAISFNVAVKFSSHVPAIMRHVGAIGHSVWNESPTVDWADFLPRVNRA